MLYFSKLRIFLTYTFILCISYFALSNFLHKDNAFINKKINLGLDLQGGSYLLLEIDNAPIILQKLQNKLISLKNNFKENNINYRNIKILNEKITFNIDNLSINKFVSVFYIILSDSLTISINDAFKRKLFCKFLFEDIRFKLSYLSSDLFDSPD